MEKGNTIIKEMHIMEHKSIYKMKRNILQWVHDYKIIKM